MSVVVSGAPSVAVGGGARGSAGPRRCQPRQKPPSSGLPGGGRQLAPPPPLLPPPTNNPQQPPPPRARAPPPPARAVISSSRPRTPSPAPPPAASPRSTPRCSASPAGSAAWPASAPDPAASPPPGDPAADTNRRKLKLGASAPGARRGNGAEEVGSRRRRRAAGEANLWERRDGRLHELQLPREVGLELPVLPHLRRGGERAPGRGGRRL